VDSGPVTGSRPPSSQPRLVSLDLLRGLTVAGMVLVNNPGTWSAIYAPLRHAAWHGWTPTDMVFPFFVFIVGVAIPIALGPRLERSGRAGTLGRVVRRSAIIFGLGLFLQSLPSFDWPTLRIPGVLQRIALCYLAASVLFLLTSWRTQAAVTAGLLLGYWLVMTTVPVPGYGAGDLSPAGNLAAYLDRVILGQEHMWRVSRVYDPEGLLSTVPAIVTALLGVLTGEWLRRQPTTGSTAARLALAGAVCAAVGQIWGAWFPVNKSLWTSSYVMLMGGLALITLALCYWLIEVQGYRRWAVPFVVFGVNALALYFLSSAVAQMLVMIRVGPENASLKSLLFNRLFAPWASPINASLAYACAYLLLWWGLMWILYRRRIVLRV
jgi:predicted acyltransferase